LGVCQRNKVFPDKKSFPKVKGSIFFNKKIEEGFGMDQSVTKGMSIKDLKHHPTLSPRLLALPLGFPSILNAKMGKCSK
jgi:hypothetical protein